MKTFDSTAITSFIISFLEKNSSYGNTVSSMITNDLDLLSAGLISSIGFIDLVSALEKEFKKEFDFENHDPGTFTSINGIIQYLLQE